MLRIYLASGWFTAEEAEEQERIGNLLEQHFSVYNPRKEGEVKKDSTEDFMTKCFLGNIDGIETADVVVVIYDFKDVGTIWEAGFAYRCKKPIVYYAERLNGKKFNLMLAKTGYFASNEQELLQILSKPLEFKKVNAMYKGDIE